MELETDVVVFNSGILPLLSLVAVEVILTSSVVLLFAKQVLVPVDFLVWSWTTASTVACRESL